MHTHMVCRLGYRYKKSTISYEINISDFLNQIQDRNLNILVDYRINKGTSFLQLHESQVTVFVHFWS